MKKLFSITVRPDHYTADACVVWCFDDRFSQMLDFFVRFRGYKYFDLIKVAGGAKDLASPGRESDREYVLEQIAKSIKLHHAPKIILMMHVDCGAYGGNQDQMFYKDELKKAKAAVSAAFKDIEINLFLTDFGGLYLMES